MARLLREDGSLVESSELDDSMLEALSDETRRRILELLSQSPSYPTEVSERMDVSKQKAYYHFDLLEESGLIDQKRQEEKSGGIANYYAPSSGSFHLDLGKKGEQTGFQPMTAEVREFLHPLVDEGDLEGSIVVGSPDEHGPDQVRGRDGYLAGDICLELGSYVSSGDISVEWDTDVFREESFDSNMLVLGGVLTNTIARKFNDAFPVSFEGENFPYRGIETSENSYSSPEIGVIAKAENPVDAEKSLILVAGIRNRGTEAAVRAFKQLEKILNEGTSYVIVEGKDMDGDGRIDDFEVVESS
ncbi:MAG: ArsR/SmtB family transcription factor [Candidatus Paceibacteria bacterium]